MARCKSILIMTLLSVVLIPFTAWADDFHVTTDQELQTAIFTIGTMVGAHTLYLAAGNYTGAFTANLTDCSSLTIKPEDGLNPGQVVFDGQNAHRCLYLDAGSRNIDLAFYDLTFKDGRSGSGAGLWLNTGGAVTVETCNFKGNTIPSTGTPNPGSALYLNNTGSSHVAFTNCIVMDSVNSSSAAGAGVYGYKAVYINVTSSAAVTVTGNHISRNINGGIEVKGPNSGAAPLIFSGNTITGNKGGNRGGGGATLTVGNGIIFENNTVTGNEERFGGGVDLSYSNATLIGNTICDNIARTGGGIYWSGAQTLVMKRNRVEGNSTSVGEAGGIYIRLDSTDTSVTLEENAFLNNSALSNGGGICIAKISSSLYNVVLKNNLIAQNQAGSSNYGGGIYVNSCSDLDLVNNTITGNTAAYSGGIYINATNTADVYNNIIWGNTATAAGATSGDIGLSSAGTKRGYFNTFHAIDGLWSTAGNNIDAAPLFISPETADYHLQSTSLCLNAGKNDAPGIPATDMDGNVRISDGTVDLGAYEHSTGDFHPADTDSNWVISAAEFTAYGASWKASGSPVPIDYVTRAGYLLQNGGTYKNIGGGKPMCWVPGP